MLGTTFGGAHLACVASLAVLEVIDKEELMQNADEQGKYLMHMLKEMEGLQNIRGKGLMIGFDVPDILKEVRKILLKEQHVFTGEAKPNVVRLLPALSIKKNEIDEFLNKLQLVIDEIKTSALISDLHNAE